MEATATATSRAGAGALDQTARPHPAARRVWRANIAVTVAPPPLRAELDALPRLLKRLYRAGRGGREGWSGC